ncbi:MAG: hypothetical protein LBR42_04465 [Candidatus Methanoplasma sp.]|jgi:hypothetical protein|nr:hypothetical protein [Candidatus Methanoplasma sp.]
MNSIKAGAIIVALILSAVAIPLAAENISGNNSTGTTAEPVFTDRNVIVYSDHAFASELRTYLLNYTSKVTNFEDAEPASAGDIAVFDWSWIVGNDVATIDDVLRMMIGKGIPVIFTGKENYLLEHSNIKLSVSANTIDEIAYCLYSHGGADHYYSIGGKLESAIRHAYTWADKISSGDDPRLVTETISWIGQESKSIHQPEQLGYYMYLASETILIGSVSYTCICDQYGTFTQSTMVYNLAYKSTAKQYFALKTSQYGSPNADAGYRLANIRLVADEMNGGSVLTYDPTTSGALSRGGVTVSYGASTSFPGIKMGVTHWWSYSPSDVSTHDNSSFAKELVDIAHCVDVTKDFGKGCLVHPEFLVSFPESKPSMQIDCHHSVNMCKETKSLMWDYYDEYSQFEFEYSIVIHGTDKG